MISKLLVDSNNYYMFSYSKLCRSKGNFKRRINKIFNKFNDSEYFDGPVNKLLNKFNDFIGYTPPQKNFSMEFN